MTLSFSHTQVRMAINKKIETTYVGEDEEKKEPLFTDG
jgi:hypothetical protein